MNFARNKIRSKAGKALVVNEYMPISIIDCDVEAGEDAIVIGQANPMDRQIYIDMKADIERGMIARELAEKYARRTDPYGLNIWDLVQRGADVSSILALVAALAGIGG